MSPSGFDLIVIGAGAMGLAVADRFLRRHRGASVLVCEDYNHPAGSTAAGAMIVAWSEVTAQTRQQTGFTERIADAEQSVRSWRTELADAEVDGRSVVTSRGLNVVLAAEAPRPEVENFAAIREVLQERGIAWETVDIDLVAGLDPIPERAAAEAIYIPEEFVVDAGLLDTWRRRGLVELGARFQTGHFRPLERNGKVAGVVSQSGNEIEADLVVLAAGSASQQLAPEPVRKLIPPLFAGVGTAATIDLGPAVAVDALRTPNRAFACGLHLLPTAGPSVYVGATNEPRADSPPLMPNVSDVEYLLRCAVLQVNRGIQRASLTGLRLGSRPIPTDAVPMVGPAMDGLWLVTGFNRDGLTRALDVAERVIAAVDGDEAALPQQWRPVRPPGSTWSAAAALDHAVANCRAMAAEADKRIDNSRWDDSAQERLVAEYTRLYEADTGFVLPPDLVGLTSAGTLPRSVTSWIAAWQLGVTA